MNTDADIQKVLETVILYRVDCEKGDGIAMAKDFVVKAYPTFVLLNKDGQTLDRWVGYEKDYLLKTLPDATADLTTIEEKRARFQSKPDLRSSVALGRYASAMGEYREAVTYLLEAQSLKTDPQTDYSFPIFENTYDGMGKELFTYQDLTAAADNALKVKSRPMIAYYVASMMVPTAQKNGNRSDIEKYLQAGLDATASGSDDEIKNARNDLMVSFSLLIKNDTATAVEYKKATMPKGWQDDPNQLNQFAWWCFENNANMKEAETLARKAVAQAKQGRERANILDTLAEILNAQGKTGEALEFSKQASAEAPDNKFFKSQVERFQKALEEKK